MELVIVFVLGVVVGVFKDVLIAKVKELVVKVKDKVLPE
ncbi:hypothetical protein UFOVP1437_6 [uncultured Caudovirales phage]|uniref:Uncharacterized protein n=1 Tax=uncultured Caudovirales phage TaxID=2100421 RepID=A0A6J5SE23_9CAUD|nr:hypothetical protein UFOVP1437_6 [uncultured Caudovirales phage]CAB5228164.1 hypothetical protein UFOVP1531_58 [uncultured Caudovirales phage]